MEILAQKRYVRSVSEKGIVYTDEFKRTFIAENEQGKIPKVIFEEHGIDLNISGLHRVSAAGKR